jgi:hypothetical protein
MESTKKVHIASFGILTESEIESLKEKLKQHDIMLEVDNSTSRAHAMVTVEDVTNLAKIILTPDAAKDLVVGIAGAVLYDVLKSVTRKFWKFAAKHRVNRMTSTSINGVPVDFKTVTDRQLKELSKQGSYLKFGWEVTVKKGLRVSFRVDPHATSKQIDTMLESFRTGQLPKWLKSKRQGDFWLTYNDATGEWRYINRQKVFERDLERIKRRVLAKKSP